MARNRAKSFEIKAVENSESGYHFSGYASTYGNSDRDGDIIEPGAFNGILNGTNKSVVPMLYQHKLSEVIGKIELSLDSKGLIARGTFNLNDERAKNVYDLVKMGALDSMSIGFFVKDYEPIDPKRPFGAWKLKELDVVETSIVTVPANSQALISNIKSLMKDDVTLSDVYTLIKASINEGVESAIKDDNNKVIEAKRAEILKILGK